MTQSKKFYLAALLALSACNSDAFAGKNTGGHYANRRGSFRRDVHSRFPINAVDDYRWDQAYECNDLNASVWPSATGGVTLNGFFGQLENLDTSGWPGLPLRFRNRGVSPGPSPGDVGYASGTFDWASSDFHMRLIMDLTSPIDERWVMRYRVLATQFAEIRYSVGDFNFNVRNDAGGLFSRSVTMPTTAMIVDWIVSGATMTVMVNGVEHTLSDHTGAVDFANGPDELTLMGLSAGDAVTATYVFVGWRWDRTLTLAEHAADAVALGL